MWWVERQFIVFQSTGTQEVATLARHNREPWRPKCWWCPQSHIDTCPVVGIQTFTSRTVPLPRGSFFKKNSSTRRFFYVDMAKVQSLPRENLKICAIWKLHGWVFWVQTKSNRRTHANQELDSRGKDLQTLSTFFVSEKIQTGGRYRNHQN